MRDDNALHGAALLHDPGRRRHADARLDDRSQVKLRLSYLILNNRLSISII